MRILSPHDKKVQLSKQLDRYLSNHSVKYWDCILHVVFMIYGVMFLTSSPPQILPLTSYNVQLSQTQKTEAETTGMKK